MVLRAPAACQKVKQEKERTPLLLLHFQGRASSAALRRGDPVIALKRDAVRSSYQGRRSVTWHDGDRVHPAPSARARASGRRRTRRWAAAAADAEAGRAALHRGAAPAQRQRAAGKSKAMRGRRGHRTTAAAARERKQMRRAVPARLPAGVPPARRRARTGLVHREPARRKIPLAARAVGDPAHGPGRARDRPRSAKRPGRRWRQSCRTAPQSP